MMTRLLIIGCFSICHTVHSGFARWKSTSYHVNYCIEFVNLHRSLPALQASSKNPNLNCQCHSCKLFLSSPDVGIEPGRCSTRGQCTYHWVTTLFARFKSLNGMSLLRAFHNPGTMKAPTFLKLFPIVPIWLKSFKNIKCRYHPPIIVINCYRLYMYTLLFALVRLFLCIRITAVGRF